MVKRFKGLFIISVILFSASAGFAVTKTWTGAVSIDWDTGENWSPSGVPTSSDEVVINSGGNQPVIENQALTTKTVEIKKLEVKTGATLKIIAKQRDIEFKGASDFLIQGQIILELRRGATRYIKISNTDFIGSSQIFIDSPLTPGINSAYHTNLEASGNINFKSGSVITADNYANDDRLIINSPKTAIAGAFTVDSFLYIQNTHDSSGLKINIPGSLTVKKDLTITDDANTKITSSGSVDLEKVPVLNTADWKASGGSITTKGDFLVPHFEQTAGTLKLAGEDQKLNIIRAHNLEIAAANTAAKPAVLQSDVTISGALTNDGVFDAQTNTKTVTFTGAESKITRSAPSPSPMPENKFHDLKIADGAKLIIELSDIGDTEHNKFVKIDIVNSFINGQNGQFVPHFSNVVFSGAATISSGNNDINFTDITIPSGKSLTINKPITVGGIFQNDGTFNGGDNKVTFRSGNADLQIAGNSATTFSEIEIISTANLALKSNITITKELKNPGKFTADSGKTVTLNPPANGTVTITGTNDAGNTKFDKLTLTNAGGKTLTIKNKITVADLDISGSAETNRLNIAGQGEITLGGDHAPPALGTPPKKGYYLNIRTNIPIADGHTYTVKKSKTDVDSGFPLSDGNPKNWVFDDYSGPLVWKGTHSSNWDDWQNWSPFAKPNEQTEVTIPRLTSSPFNYPNLGTGADPNAKAKSVTVNDGAELDLGKYLIKDGGSAGAETSSVANNGTLKMTGTAGQKKWLEDTDNNDKITHGDKSTIQYNFGPAAAVIWAGSYKNLIMRTGGANIQVKSGAGLATLTVEKDFTIHKDSTLSMVETSSVTVGNCMYINKAVTLKTNTSGITVAKNTFIAAPAGDSVTFSNTYLKTESFVLLGGNVTLGNDVTGNASSALWATGDIVLFGSDYEANDTAADADPSGTPDLFTYKHWGRNGTTAMPSVDTSLFPKAPDGTELFDGKDPKIHAGSFADLSGKTLKADKNFYANGMSFVPAGTGTWKLDIPANGKATDSFAEAYFTTVKNCTVTDGAFVAAAEKYIVINSPAWKTDRPTISEAYTVSDDTIYVKFSKPIENSNNEINKAIRYIKFDNDNYGFTKAYTDSGCTTSTDGKGDLNQFYIRVENGTRWNTDANGTSAGSNDSTCRGGYNGSPPRHWNNYVDLSIPKALGYLYASLRDEHKNRIRHYAGGAADTSGDNGKRYGKVEDRCPPVLAAVYTGQEEHVHGSTQHAYDAHNFIEFRYSEPVFINGTTDADVNKPVTGTLGNITPFGSGIEIAGLGQIASGSLSAGISFPALMSPPQQPHAWYRNFPAAWGGTDAPTTNNQNCRIRISIAGYRDSANNWIGYIDSAVSPSGLVTPLNGVNIRTRELNPSDPLDPPLEAWEKLDTTFRPRLYSSSSGGNSYVSYHPLASSWDTSPPVFAKASDDSAKWLDLANTSKEITAYSASSQFADKIEFHFFDNTPDYTSTALWWQTAGALISNPGWNVVSPPDRYDSYGGSRFTDPASPPYPKRTTGGIRACTLPAVDKVKDVFIFNAEKSEFNAALQKFSGTDTAAYPLMLSQKAENQAVFGSLPSGFSEQDSLYLQLRITPPSAPLKFPVTEIFTLAYRGIDTDSNGGRITDLAGNLMKSCSGAKSIDASPPNIALTAAPVGLNQIYVLFTSQIDTRPETLAKIPGNLELIGLPTGSTIRIDSAVPARVRTDTKKGTGIIVSLTEPVTYNLLTTAKLQVKKDDNNLIHIYPKVGAYPAFVGHKHVISDFAVNIIRPLFAYDERKLDDGTSGFITAGIYGGTSQAVRLFDGSGIPGNTVLEKEDITVHLAVENVLPGDTSAPTNLELYMENNPNPASVSVNLNKATNLGSRIWLPAIRGLPPGAVSGLSVLSPEENPCSLNEVIPLSPTNPGGFKYEFKLFNNPLTVPLSPKFLNFPDGSRAEFLFALKNGGGYILIDHDCDDGGSSPTPKIPLYALRLKDPNDPASIDLWSFDISAIKKQAGGVSILNNVINVEIGEKCTIAVTAEKAGSLSVMVMTLDGDVVKVLYSGHAEKGEHLYRWNGTNKNGEAVARGMYFIRVLGPGIDETRKVMAVKE